MPGRAEGGAKEWDISDRLPYAAMNSFQRFTM